MRPFLCALAIAAAAVPACAQDEKSEHVRGRYRFWLADIEGTMRADGAGLAGTEVDLVDDMGLERSPGINSIAVGLVVPGLGRVELDYWRGAFTGEDSLATAQNFGGTGFSAGSLVETKLEWTSFTTLFEYSLYFRPDDASGSRVGLRSGTMYLRLEGTMESGPTEGTSTPDGIMPVLGVVADIHVTSWFSFEVALTGTSVTNFGAFGATVVDAVAMARVTFGQVYFGAGYRVFSIDLEEDGGEPDENESDIVIRGIVVEGGFGF